MATLLGIVFSILGLALLVLVAKLYFDRMMRRRAEEARPKIEALLDEMIRVVASHSGSKDEIIGTNTVKTVNDEMRDRYLSMHAGDTSWSLDVSTVLVGKKAGYACVSIYRNREDASLHLYWPSVIEYWPMEPWLHERLERLDKLVGNASFMRRVKRRLADDGAPPTYS